MTDHWRGEVGIDSRYDSAMEDGMWREQGIEWTTISGSKPSSSSIP